MGVKIFRASLTHVVVSRDGHGGSGTGTLLGEVVAEFEDAGVVLQHGGDLHLDRVSQLLPLHGREEGDAAHSQERSQNIFRNVTQGPDKNIKSPLTNLVIDLKLHQRGVFGHSLDDRHHAVRGDEV